MKRKMITLNDKVFHLQEMINQENALQSQICKLKDEKRVMEETVFQDLEIAHDEYGFYVEHITPVDSYYSIHAFIMSLKELPVQKQCFSEYWKKHQTHTQSILDIDVLQKGNVQVYHAISNLLPRVLSEIVLSFMPQFQKKVITLQTMSEYVKIQKATIVQLQNSRRTLEQDVIMMMHQQNIMCFDNFELRKRKCRDDYSLQDVDDFIQNITELPPNQSFREFWNKKSHVYEKFYLSRLKKKCPENFN